MAEELPRERFQRTQDGRGTTLVLQRIRPSAELTRHRGSSAGPAGALGMEIELAGRAVTSQVTPDFVRGADYLEIEIRVRQGFWED